MITFKLNGKDVQGEEGQYILRVAEKYGIEIPTLCHHKALDPAGMCRLCTVELFDGRRTRFVTACNYPIWEGMEIETDTETVHEGRKLIVELLFARCPDVPIISELAAQYHLKEPRFRIKDDTCILCGLCTRICDKIGTSAIGLTGRGVDMKVDTPFHVQTEACLACGACVFVCPTGHIKLEDITKHAIEPIPSEYDMGLADRKPIYVPYAQAIPNTPVIDRTRCVHFKTDGCKICADFCAVDAIDHSQEDETIELNVGSIILSTGLKPFDPTGFDTYQYSKFPNVVTSLEFERLLSAGGPTGGHVLRPSDMKEPSKVAWFQCIGSRDVNRCDNEYCSSVCCMYALKEAVIAKEHLGKDFEPAIFFMDIRTHGKDFEKYYERAKSEGVRFIRSRVHTITEADETGTLNLRYVTESGEVISEDFDMVVLSIGMEPADSAVDAAKKLGIELNRYNFVETENTLPVATSRPGIYVAGVIQGCQDIPESIVQASAAACNAGISLASVRGTLVKDKEFPEESDVSGQEPRLGVFVCNCGVNIGGIADVPAIAEYTKSLPGVVYVEENLFTCSQDTQENMVEVIKNHHLNRIVVAACTPRTHEPLFQETVRNAGLNPYLFEMANIRNQCTWVHSDEKEKVTEKCKDLVKMSIDRASLLEPIPELSVQVNTSGLIIGGGVAGMTAALSLADQGFPATIVEKSPVLGGAARDVMKTWGGSDVQEYLSGLLNKVETHPHIEIFLNAEVVGASGFVGNFETEISYNNMTKKITHGVTVVATGGRPADTDEYLYGKNPRVTRWHDLEHRPDKLNDAKSVVFIQCVGSRDEKRPYCSRICCTASVSQAISIKEQNPDTDVYILYRDIRTYGEREALYKEAREKGVMFIRYSPDRKPTVNEVEDGLEVNVFDPILQRDLNIKADFVNLATAIEPADNDEVASVYKLPLNEEKFFMEAHAKLRPVEFASDGLFVCGLAHYPKAIDENIAQAMAAASRAAAILSKPSIAISPLVSQVETEKCIGCGLCDEICAFGAIILEESEGKGQKAKNISASCKGCGLCAASCPQKAIDMLHFRDRQIVASVCAVA